MPHLTIVDKIVLAALAFLLVATLLPRPAHPHEWYPRECCSGQDCARVEKIEQLPEGMRVTTKHGTVLVPTDFKRRESQDSDFHACISNYPSEDGTAGPALICFFEPKGS